MKVRCSSGGNTLRLVKFTQDIWLYKLKIACMKMNMGLEGVLTKCDFFLILKTAFFPPNMTNNMSERPLIDCSKTIKVDYRTTCYF